jgi:hypothetical protein
VISLPSASQVFECAQQRAGVVPLLMQLSKSFLDMKKPAIGILEAASSRQYRYKDDIHMAIKDMAVGRKRE